jgi:hypothetical protein
MYIYIYINISYCTCNQHVSGTPRNGYSKFKIHIEHVLTYTIYLVATGRSAKTKTKIDTAG